MGVGETGVGETGVGETGIPRYKAPVPMANTHIFSKFGPKNSQSEGNFFMLINRLTNCLHFQESGSSRPKVKSA